MQNVFQGTLVTILQIPEFENLNVHWLDRQVKHLENEDDVFLPDFLAGVEIRLW